MVTWTYRAEHWEYGPRLTRGHGFTLIEILVVMAVLAVLATLVLPRYADRVDQAREVTLKQDLFGLRTAIDQFNRDKGRYPQGLDELVTLRYIRAIPVDPITQRADTWVLIPPGQNLATGVGTGSNVAGGVFDVRSGASGKAADGSAYASW